MKKIVFKNVYECLNCKKRIVGYVDYCPLCRGKVQKTNEDKLVTFIKGPQGPKGPQGVSLNDYYRP